MFKPELMRKVVFKRHKYKLAVGKLELERRQIETLGFEVEVFYVVQHGVTQNYAVPIFEKPFNFVIHLGKGRLFFKIAVFIWQNYTLFPLSVGKLEPAARVYKDIFLFENIKIFVADDIPERANFGVSLVHAGAFYVEKN